MFAKASLRFKTASDQKRTSQMWGAVRRKSAFARLLHAVNLTLMGLIALVAIVLTAIFAGLIALLGSVFVGVMGVIAMLNRKPAKVSVRENSSNKLYEARKQGTTWVVY